MKGAALTLDARRPSVGSRSWVFRGWEVDSCIDRTLRQRRFLGIVHCLSAVWIGGAVAPGETRFSRDADADPDVLARRMGCHGCSGETSCDRAGSREDHPSVSTELSSGTLPGREVFLKGSRREIDEMRRDKRLRRTTTRKPRRSTATVRVHRADSRPAESPDEEVRELTLEVGPLRTFEVTAVGQSHRSARARRERLRAGAFHFRLYGDRGPIPEKGARRGNLIVKICVRRCNYVDDLQRRGVQGRRFELPLRSPGSAISRDPDRRAVRASRSKYPRSMHANLILIGSGHRHRAVPRPRPKHLYDERAAMVSRGESGCFTVPEDFPRTPVHERREE